MSAKRLRDLPNQWKGRLNHYRGHHNDEHLEALLDEASHYCLSVLGSRLAKSSYWSEAPPARCVAVLLFLVDRGAAARISRGGRTRFEAAPEAESWASSQPGLTPYLGPTLELIAALRQARNQQSRS